MVSGSGDFFWPRMLTTAGRACRTATTTGVSLWCETSRAFVRFVATSYRAQMTANAAPQCARKAQGRLVRARSGWVISGESSGMRHDAGANQFINGSCRASRVVPESYERTGDAMQATSAHRYYWLKRYN